MNSCHRNLSNALARLTLAATALILLAARAGDPVESFVERLPAPLRANPVLVHHSRSLQGASFKSPRIILGDAQAYGGDDVVYSFNGDPLHTGFDRVEAMRFDDNSARFSFFEVTFDAAGNPVRSPDNPAQCMNCHRGPDPRPNWESYDSWPGVYGSNDDRLANDEVIPFKDFIGDASSRPRYGVIDWANLRAVLRFPDTYGRLPGEPNITMTYKLSRANLMRVARLITESPGYRPFKYLIAGVLNEPGSPRQGLHDFVPDELQAVLLYYDDAEVKEAQEVAPSIGGAYAIPGTLRLRSLFEARGIDVSSWFMNFKSGVGNTFVNGTAWEKRLLFELLKRDPELASFGYLGSEIQLDQIRLADASKEALADLLARDTSFDRRLRRFATDPAVSERIWAGSCATCHARRSPENAPPLSWQEARNRPRFRSLVTSGRMPPDQVLTPSEKRHLLGHTPVQVQAP